MIEKNQIEHYIQFLFKKNYNTDAPKELIDRWINVPEYDIQNQLNNLYNHWKLDKETITSWENEFKLIHVSINTPKQSNVNYQPQHSTPSQPFEYNNANNINTSYNQYPTPKSKNNTLPIIIIIGLILIGAFIFYQYAISDKHDSDIINKPNVVIDKETLPDETKAVMSDTTPSTDARKAIEAEKTDRINTISQLLKAEENREMETILSNFNNIVDYWDAKKADKAKIQELYYKTWQKIDDIKYHNIQVLRSDKNTYDVTGNYSFYNVETDSNKTLPINTRYIFNNEGKIIKTYGLK